ncbi:MAG: hypothetical protein K8R23_18960 [Chthoniobacter sp.]|nr:hypothetical protein [Chthoniobacter sp.]
MEILVVVVIVLVLAAIAFPVFSSIRNRSNKAEALDRMRQVTASLLTYAAQNDGDFPMESIAEGNTWATTSGPLGEKAWFNVLPRMVGHKGVGDYLPDRTSYYSKGNLLFLPGAKYPAAPKRLKRPYFAFAMNTKLQRKDPTTKLKNAAKLSQITMPARTIAFLESGLPGEVRPMSGLPRYEGEPKTSARSFVERYSGQGVLTFLDGHAETVGVRDLLNPSGNFTVPQIRFVWTRTPEENPNHGAN